jgi:hypothetical protein
MNDDRRRQPDDEWRNDRTARRDLLACLGGDVDRAQVALAVYEAQRTRKPESEREGRDDL